MDEQQQTIGNFISYSGSDIDNKSTNNNTMVSEAAAIPQAVDVKPDEVQVPLPSLPQEAEPIALNPNPMGALATAAADQADDGTKRPGEPIEGAAKKAKYEPVVPAIPQAAPPAPAADPAVWESLMAQVRGQLRAMTSDECFSRALELQMLARSEVGNRSQHLSNAMDLMANNPGQQPDLAKMPKRNPPNMSVSSGQRVTKAEREVSKQKPIKTNKSAPVPCMKMTPPLPPRCEHDNAPGVELPAFCQLVNFPTARYYGNCVMCDESEFAIPKQNKGVCNNCDVAIWVVNPSGMNIKWCKGCKNFRKWIDFGVKGYSSKCERCRQQQATRYANQKNKEQVAQPMSVVPTMVGAVNHAAAVQPMVDQAPQHMPPAPVAAVVVDQGSQQAVAAATAGVVAPEVAAAAAIAAAGAPEDAQVNI